jgi:ATP-dependent Lon protease
VGSHAEELGGGPVFLETSDLYIHVPMTGGLTLRGRVPLVGGIKSNVIAADLEFVFS